MEDTTNVAEVQDQDIENLDQVTDDTTSQVDDKENKEKDVTTKTQIETDDAEKDLSKVENDSTEFEKTGNAVLDFAIDAVAGMGFKPNDPAIALAYEGDFDLLKAQMSTKGAKGWEQIIALLEKGYAEEVQKQQDFTKSIDEAVKQVVDGDTEYRDKIFAFAKENGTDSEVKTLNSMLDSDPFAAKVAMSYLKNVYESSTNKTQQPSQAVAPNAMASNVNASALSPDEFFEEREKLAERIGMHKLAESSEYKKLVARRMAWR